MTKEEIIEFHTKEMEKYDNLVRRNLVEMSKALHAFANSIDSNGMVNEYEFEKILSQMEDIKRYNQCASTERTVIGTLKMIET